MLNDAKGFTKICVACGYTDLRLGIDGLSQIVQSKFELNPFEENVLFVFCGRKTDRIKCLLWEGDGFLLLYKRLERGSFQWPRHSDEVLNMTEQQYRWLMEGLAIVQEKAVKKSYPKQVF